MYPSRLGQCSFTISTPDNLVKVVYVCRCTLSHSCVFIVWLHPLLWVWSWQCCYSNTSKHQVYIHVHTYPFAIAFCLSIDSLPFSSCADTCLEVNVCCYVLAEHFQVSFLPQEALDRIKTQLTLDSAILLLRFADGVQSRLLRDVCMACLKHSSNGTCT